jgi:hypothetical protein
MTDRQFQRCKTGIQHRNYEQHKIYFTQSLHTSAFEIYLPVLIYPQRLRKTNLYNQPAKAKRGPVKLSKTRRIHYEKNQQKDFSGAFSFSRIMFNFCGLHPRRNHYRAGRAAFASRLSGNPNRSSRSGSTGGFIL